MSETEKPTTDAIYALKAKRESAFDIRAQRDALLEACKGLLEQIKNNTLVRNTNGDGDPGWAIKQLPLVLALSKANDAIAKAERAA